MISVEEARAIILAHARTMGTEHISLRRALGRTLAHAVVAKRAQPPFAASAMDGYAVRSADTPGPLRVVGEVRAGGAPLPALSAGDCARIFTGGALPEGADAVVIQEDAEREGDTIQAPRVEPQDDVRAAGVDFPAGATLLEGGRILDAPAVTLAAAAGLANVGVLVQPKIAMFTGGDEIVPPGTPPGPTQIYDSISYGLGGFAAAWGAVPLMTAPLKDSVETIAAKVAEGSANADLILVAGGASVGDYDLARKALESLGADLLFAKVAVRPGKPTWFAMCKGVPVLGLPGNPASAMVCARLFLRPLLERMLGRDPAPVLMTQNAQLTAPLKANGPRENYLRAITQVDETGQLRVAALSDQDSSLTTVLAAANALIVRTPKAEALDAGALVPTLAF